MLRTIQLNAGSCLVCYCAAKLLHAEGRYAGRLQQQRKNAQLAQHFVVQVAPVRFVILLYSVGFNSSLVDLLLSVHGDGTHSVPHGPSAPDALYNMQRFMRHQRKQS